ncbi:uncharacterized protein A4U43_C05F28530 [Asparagus officinalis]|uniref:GATA-type domain-containing protein n=1 Tax=Asparagus officinalis TaxID=4686 RepID=A0A5P1EV41_ASPOF|nr:uncharacterized protein A4U43_C05F28530 [Asparagus officinalis]
MESSVSYVLEGKEVEVSSNHLQTADSANPQKAPKQTRVDSASSTSTNSCAMCGGTRTTKWRNGPQGPKTLCNKCGLRYQKNQPPKSSDQQKKISNGSSGKKKSKAPYKALLIRATP